MSHNADRYMTFCKPEQAKPQVLQGLQNVGGMERGNGAKRNDLAEWNPSTEGAYIYRMLCDVGSSKIPFYVVQRMDKKLKNTLWLSNKKEDGTINKIPCAVSGNKIHAYRRGIRTEKRAAQLIDGKLDHCTFVTLTGKYVKTEKGRRASWEQVKNELPKYIRKLRKVGLQDYLYSLEAHEDGGCHVHLLCRWKQKIRSFEYKGKLRVKNKALRCSLKDWNGQADIQAIRKGTEEKTTEYLVKELGKFGHCEYALKRAKKNWQGVTDDKIIKADKKKLYTHYYGTVLKYRLYGASKTQKGEKVQAEHSEAQTPSDLLNNMNNSPKKEKTITIRIPKYIVNSDAFDPVTGTVDPSSKEYEMLNKLFEEAEKKQRNESE